MNESHCSSIPDSPDMSIPRSISEPSGGLSALPSRGWYIDIGLFVADVDGSWNPLPIGVEVSKEDREDPEFDGDCQFGKEDIGGWTVDPN